MDKKSRAALKAEAMEILKYQGIQRWCVLFLKHNREQRSPWFYSKSRAQQAFDLLTAKYGKNNTVLHLD